MLKRIIIISINALCLIAFFICLGISASIRGTFRSQEAAAVWAGQSGERFAQLSVFFPESFIFSFEDVYRLRTSLDTALLRASMEATPDRTLYTDAWSAEADVTVLSKRSSNNPVTVRAIAVGGDFFLFHPYYLRSGSYISPSDIMKDRVVIDEDLAWRLFGAINVAGFELTINNKTFTVAGIISRESDFANTKAYTFGAGLFMSYDAFESMIEGDIGIMTYELVMPDPVTGFALKILTEAISADSGAHIVENSARFGLGKIFGLIGSFGESSMRTDTVMYPYWENAVRFAEARLALLLVLTLIFAIFPTVCAVIYLVILIRFGVKHLKLYISKQISKRDKKKYEKYILDHGEEPQIYTVDEILREANDEIY